MTSPRLVLRFHSRRMLLTLDFSTLLVVLFDEFGEDLNLQIVAMTDQERENVEDRTGIITIVQSRFLLEDHSDPLSPVRRDDLEERIVQLGRK